MNELKIGIVVSTIREGRKSIDIANWILEESKKYSNNEYEIVDLKEYNLPMLGLDSSNEIINKFISKTASLDGFIFVLAEYNHSIPGVLKNALDYLGKTMNHKSAAIVSYGALGGARAAEHLRGILSQMDVAHISTHIGLSLFYDFDENRQFKPLKLHDKNLETMFIRVEEWSNALKHLR